MQRAVLRNKLIRLQLLVSQKRCPKSFGENGENKLSVFKETCITIKVILPKQRKRL